MMKPLTELSSYPYTHAEETTHVQVLLCFYTNHVCPLKFFLYICKLIRFIQKVTSLLGCLWHFCCILFCLCDVRLTQKALMRSKGTFCGICFIVQSEMKWRSWCFPDHLFVIKSSLFQLISKWLHLFIVTTCNQLMRWMRCMYLPKVWKKGEKKQK